jgi:hypothetical protein
MSDVRDADTLRVLLGACESAARGLEAAAALLADRVNLGGIIEDHAARHLRMCRRLERLARRAGDDELEPTRRPAVDTCGLTRADAVILEACREVEERAEAAYRLALAVTEREALRAELGDQHDEIRRLREDIDALRAPALGSPA